jgi:hypothetical protein
MAEGSANRNGRRLVIVLVIGAIALAIFARYNRVKLVPETQPTTQPASEE